MLCGKVLFCCLNHLLIFPELFAAAKMNVRENQEQAFSANALQRAFLAF